MGEEIEGALSRLSKDFGVCCSKNDAVGHFNNPTGSKGRHHLHLMFLVDLEGNPNTTDTRGWFSLTGLPKPMIPYHEQVIIPTAYEHYMLNYGISRIDPY